jgi:hypothetical protein
MPAAKDVRSCPYCKEEIKADALRCKHCRSTITPELPPHGGTCPFCKEQVLPEAIKCKHCGSAIGPDAVRAGRGGCGCGCGGSGDSNAGAEMIGGAPIFDGGDAMAVDEHSSGGVSARPSGVGCGDCEPNGTIGNIGGAYFLKGRRTCCKMVPFWINGKVVFKRICWTESCTTGTQLML